MTALRKVVGYTPEARALARQVGNLAEDIEAMLGETDPEGDGTTLANRTLTAGAGMTGGGDLSADRTFNVVAAAGGSITVNANSIQRAALTGDVAAPADSNVTTIANNAVSNAKLADMATQRIKGRTTAGTGDPEDLTAAQVVTMLGISTGITQGQAVAIAAGFAMP